MQNLNLILTKVLLLFFDTSLIIFGGFSFVIIGIIMLIGKDIFIWSILSLICGCIPLFLGVHLVNQFGKMTKLDYQKHNLIYNSFDNSIDKKATNHLENQNFSNQQFESQIKIQKQKSFSEQFFGKNKTQEVEIYLDRVFYELLGSKNGYLTTLNLAMEVKISGKIANEFLT